MDRTEFLVAWASKRLGRDLTDSEIKAISGVTSRHKVIDILESSKGSAKAKPKKTKSVSVEEVVEEIVNEEQGKRGKGSA